MPMASRIGRALLLSLSLGCGTAPTQAALEQGGGPDGASPAASDVLAADSAGPSPRQGGESDADSSGTKTAGDAGLTDAGTPDGGTDASFGSSPCARCLSASCGPELTACSGDPDCANYLACLNACPSGPSGAVAADCQETCPTGASTSGAAAEQQLIVCMTAGAGSQCPGCGGDASAGNPILHQQCETPTSFANGCDQCTQTYCCVTETSCRNDPDCFAYFACILPCENDPSDDGGADDGDVEADAAEGPSSHGDAGAAPGLPAISICEEMCAQQYPNGRGAWAGFSTCGAVYCGAPNACDTMATACLQCTTTQCANEYANYVGSSDGFALAFCISGCSPTDLACLSACGEEFSDGLSSATAVNECALENCPACQPP